MANGKREAQMTITILDQGQRPGKPAQRIGVQQTLLLKAMKKNRLASARL